MEPQPYNTANRKVYENSGFFLFYFLDKYVHDHPSKTSSDIHALLSSADRIKGCKFFAENLTKKVLEFFLVATGYIAAKKKFFLYKNFC